MKKLLRTVRTAGYDALAPEYYDETRHPTSANFRELSEQFLQTWLSRNTLPDGLVCEVGAGKSIIAPATRSGNDLQRLIITDSSRSMLEYSKEWASKGARLEVADAAALPLRDESVALLACSLADPYNTEEFWDEASRVLRRGGVALFTIPSYEWAHTFRVQSHESDSEATFELADGSCIRVPSIVLPYERQATVIASARLRVAELSDMTLGQLVGQVSPRLLPERGPMASALSCYVVVKAT